MTDFIIGKRQSGKTTELIKRSAETGAIIVAATMIQADAIYYEATTMGFDIPRPISIRVLQNIISGQRKPYTYNELKTKGLLVDELQLLFRQLFNSIPVNAVTVTNYQDKIITLPGGIDC